MPKKPEYVDREGNVIDEDDIVIAPMDVEGMPWHEKKKRRGRRPEQQILPPPPVTRRQLLGTIFRTTAIAILVALGFIALGAAGILLLLRLWL